MRIKLPIDIGNLKNDDPLLVTSLDQIIGSMVGVINGEVSLIDNVKSSVVTVNFTAANTEQAVRHTLGVLPLGYFVIASNLAAIVYNGTTSHTKDALYVRSNVIATIKLLIF